MRYTLAAAGAAWIFMLLVAPAQGALVEYTFSGTPGSLAPTILNPNTNSSNVSFSGSVSNNGATDFLNLSGWSATTEAGAFAAGDFLSFTLNANPGYHLNLGALSWYWSDGFGPGGQGFVRTSIDGFSTNLFGPAIAPASGLAFEVVFLNDPSFQGISSLEVRFYGFASSSSKQIHFDNIKINGTAEVPEPSVTGMLLLGGLGIAIAGYRRRRQQRVESGSQG
jgi:hypothetical protein